VSNRRRIKAWPLPGCSKMSEGGTTRGGAKAAHRWNLHSSDLCHLVSAMIRNRECQTNQNLLAITIQQLVLHGWKLLGLDYRSSISSRAFREILITKTYCLLTLHSGASREELVVTYLEYEQELGLRKRYKWDRVLARRGTWKRCDSVSCLFVTHATDYALWSTCHLIQQISIYLHLYFEILLRQIPSFWLPPRHLYFRRFPVGRSYAESSNSLCIKYLLSDTAAYGKRSRRYRSASRH